MHIEHFQFPSQWKLQNETESVAVFLNDSGDQLSLNYFSSIPDIGANIEDENAIRCFYRTTAEANSVALVEADVVKLDGLRAVRTVLKVRLVPRGFAFLGSFTIPFAQCSFVLKFQSLERGTTGAREAAVMVIEGARFSVDEESGKILGWAQDPYDPSYQGSFMRNFADDSRFDKAFPEHPLSKVRRYLEELSYTVCISDSVKQLSPFVYAGA